MTKKEFLEREKAIKMKAIPLGEQGKQLVDELKEIEKQLQGLREQKQENFHRFCGCYTCKFAVYEALGKQACCDYEGDLPHEPNDKGSDIDLMADQTPGCKVHCEGEPKHDPNYGMDPLQILLGQLRGKGSLMALAEKTKKKVAVPEQKTKKITH